MSELALKRALSPWERALTFESLKRWLLRGAVGALLTICAVLLVGWVVPIPETDLRPWAAVSAVIPLVAALLTGLWPRGRPHNTADLDGRLHFEDRLATAWAFRTADDPIAQLQREDALRRLAQRAPKRDLQWTPSRYEWVGVGICALVTILLLATPSPQQRVLDDQAAEEIAVQQASVQLDTLRQQSEASASLTPDQVRQLDELLQQAQTQLKEARTEQEAANVVARAQDQLSQQLGDPNADLRDEALAAMSETLSAEPQTKSLGDALQREDTRAASQAIQDLAGRADQLSDVERQSLARALQRASNVGRSDTRTATAMRDAAQALTSNASSQQALAQVDASLRESIQASQSQAALNATQQQLRELQSRLANSQPLNTPADQASGFALAPNATAQALASGTPVALDSGAASRTVSDPSLEQGGGAGSGPTSGTFQPQSAAGAQAAENVFVPGRVSDSPGDQPQQVDQPFTVRGAPRPYRDVLNQYAQSGRDYVDRPDISPAVRDLVKQYFQELESGQ